MKFSIIICTYNPKEQNLNRLLNSISKFNYDLASYEVIIIDNSSTIPVNRFQYIKEFSNNFPSFKVYSEERIGLSYARMKGIELSSNEWLIFFDDDNCPESNYLKGLETLLQIYPEVVCWGPGKINVKFIDEPNLTWLNDYKENFQEKNIDGTIIHSSTLYNSNFPTGTGMAIRKDIAFDYCRKVKAGSYTLTDRSKNKLSSGGDVQIVLHAISLGYHVGVSSILQLIHCIDATKSNLKYLVRHAYATAKYNLKTYIEIFPISLENQRFPSNKEFYKQLYYHLKVIFLKFGFRKAIISFSSYLGRLDGILLVRPETSSTVMFRLFKSILQLSFNINT